MNLTITDTAAEWYINELQLQNNQNLHFYVRYGAGGHQPGFSLAISTDDKKEPAAETTVKGITFFIESEDIWYFDGADLLIEFDENMQEPAFHYQS